MDDDYESEEEQEFRVAERQHKSAVRISSFHHLSMLNCSLTL